MRRGRLFIILLIGVPYLQAQSDGTLDTTSIYTTRLASIVTLAHQNGVKVLISVGGGADSANFKLFANTTTGRSRFVSSIQSFVTTYNLDGVDIDWEYPDSGYSQAYTALMQAIYTAFHPLNLLVTSAVPASSWSGDYYLSSSFPYVDFFNIMAYDFSGSWAPDQPGPHASYDQIVGAISYWLTTRGLSPSKTVLGIPFYGKDFSVGGADITYSDIVALYHPTPDLNQFNQIYFDGINLVKSKCQLALTDGLAGVMVWEYSQDSVGASSLITAITSVMLATSTSSPTTSQTSAPTTAPTAAPTTTPTTIKPTTTKPTTVAPTTIKPTTIKPTTIKPTTIKPTTIKPTTASPTSTTPCGGGFIGNGICSNTKLCCSQWGWCGSTAAYCG